jgi:hypothetical protein
MVGMRWDTRRVFPDVRNAFVYERVVTTVDPAEMGN